MQLIMLCNFEGLNLLEIKKLQKKTFFPSPAS